MKKKPVSLKWSMMAVTLMCWIVPIILVSAVAATLMNNYYEQTLHQTIESGAEHSMKQTEMLLYSAMEESKSVSYDGQVRKAYRSYLVDGDAGIMYRSISEYLLARFIRNESVDAVFVSFLNGEIDANPYYISTDMERYNILQRYRTRIQPLALQCAKGSDTAIYFIMDEDNIYMVRNILDSSFEPYATLVMLCDRERLFQPLDSVGGVTLAKLRLDDIELDFTPPDIDKDGSFERDIVYTGEISGHTLVYTASVENLNIWNAIPSLKWAVILTILLILPLMVVIIYLFYRQIDRPIETLIDGTSRVQAGERGFQIPNEARSLEFMKLYGHFNSMSSELKNQFERIVLEQQAAQQARVKTLQSQINPHFLNNTLEVINWEARIAGNERVSAMIEALSTMLNAAIGRDGRSQIPFKEELGYADAYLYIIKQRLGDRLTIEKHIDEKLFSVNIPRLIIQPILENAVEHDIYSRESAQLCLRVYEKDRCMFIEVEHDGDISPSDRENILKLLSATESASPVDGRMGIQNVSLRLKLLYGQAGGLGINEIRPGRILARLTVPFGVDSRARPENNAT